MSNRKPIVRVDPPFKYLIIGTKRYKFVSWESNALRQINVRSDMLCVTHPRGYTSQNILMEYPIEYGYSYFDKSIITNDGRLFTIIEKAK